MWILPKQLHTLASVQDTEGLNLDLNESSQLCAQSLFVRSKPSPLRTWLQKWKRDSWTQHLFGRILKPSLGKAFEIEWTSLLEAIPVSPSVQQESDSVQKTNDTCGHTLPEASLFSSQEFAYLKTSKDILRWDSPLLSAIWKKWVTKCRGAYSARLNVVRFTNAKECGSWPTAKARDWKDTAGCSLDAVNPDGSHRNRRDRLMGAVMAEISGPPAQGNHNMHGSRQESWATPRAGCPGSRAPGTGGKVLEEQVKEPKAWATPQSRDAKGAEGRMIRDGNSTDLPSQTEVEQTGAWNRNNGRLNPRWVETLMGVPIGWTMPSCTSPVTIAQTSCASLETALCLPAQH